MTRPLLRHLAAMLPLLAGALMPSAVSAQGYTGSWPFSVTDQASTFKFQDVTYCITLTDTGCTGRAHCGSATINRNPQLGIYEKLYGYFQVISQLILVEIDAGGSSTGEPTFWVFVAPTTDTTTIGTGLFEVAGGGDTGVLTVGKKHGCAPWSAGSFMSHPVSGRQAFGPGGPVLTPPPSPPSSAASSTRRIRFRPPSRPQSFRPDR